MEIRKARQDDFKHICQIMTSEEELFLVYPKGTYPLTTEQLEHLAKVRQDLTVVTDQQKIIGFCSLFDFTPGTSAFIGNLIVDQTYRRRAIGKKMVAWLLELIFDRYDLPEAHLYVFSHNTPALALYTKFGFTSYDTIDWKDARGKSHDLILMKLSRTDYRATETAL